MIFATDRMKEIVNCKKVPNKAPLAPLKCHVLFERPPGIGDDSLNTVARLICLRSRFLHNTINLS